MLETEVEARCGDSSRKDCRNFNDDEQKNINQSFWQMGSWNLQRALLSAHVKVKSKERDRKKIKMVLKMKESPDNTRLPLCVEW